MIQPRNGGTVQSRRPGGIRPLHGAMGVVTVVAAVVVAFAVLHFIVGIVAFFVKLVIVLAVLAVVVRVVAGGSRARGA